MDIYAARQAIATGKHFTELNLRVVYYARVSTKKDDQLVSLEHQQQYYTNFINEHKNWQYAGEYIDEGLTGLSSAKRTNFMRMIADAKAGKFDLIITKEIPRFARNTVDSLIHTRELLQYGVGVYFQNNNLCTLTQDGEFMLTLLSGMAQEESRKTSERVKWGHQQSIKNGVVLGNNNIFGYKKNNGKLVIDETQAKIVKELFELYATGKYSMKQLEKYFYDKGIRNSRGNKLAHSTMSNIIRNPKYKGYYCGNKVKVLDMFTKEQKFLPESEWVMFKDESGEICPAIISEEIWDKANYILRKRSDVVKNARETTYKPNLYTGILYCKKHNTPFYKKQNKRKGTEYDPFWICKHKIENGTDSCETIPIYETELSAILTDIIKQIAPSMNEYIDKYIALLQSVISTKNIDKEIEEVKNEVYLLQRKKDKLLELCLEGRLSSEEFEARNQKFNEEFTILNQKSMELEREKNGDYNIAEMTKTIKTQLTKFCEFKEFDFTKDNIENMFKRIYIEGVDKNTFNVEVILQTGQVVESFFNKDKRSSDKVGSLGQTTNLICHKLHTSFIRENRTAITHHNSYKINVSIAI